MGLLMMVILPLGAVVFYGIYRLKKEEQVWVRPKNRTSDGRAFLRGTCFALIALVAILVTFWWLGDDLPGLARFFIFLLSLLLALAIAASFYDFFPNNEWGEKAEGKLWGSPDPADPNVSKTAPVVRAQQVLLVALGITVFIALVIGLFTGLDLSGSPSSAPTTGTTASPTAPPSSSTPSTSPSTSPSSTWAPCDGLPSEMKQVKAGEKMLLKAGARERCSGTSWSDWTIEERVTVPVLRAGEDTINCVYEVQLPSGEKAVLRATKSGACFTP